MRSIGIRGSRSEIESADDPNRGETDADLAIALDTGEARCGLTKRSISRPGVDPCTEAESGGHEVRATNLAEDACVPALPATVVALRPVVCTHESGSHVCRNGGTNGTVLARPGAEAHRDASP